MKKIKIQCIGDTHGMHEELELERSDIIIHVGDTCNSGSFRDGMAFLAWAKRQLTRGICDEFIFVAGNHDFTFEMIDKSYIPQGLVWLNNEEYETRDGLKIYGSPITPTFGHWAFMRERGDEISKVWKKIPKGLDILITHGPAYQILDRNSSREYCGCYDLGRYIKERKPKYHLFGHIHESYGTYKDDHTTYINCSTATGEYALTNKPIMINIIKENAYDY